MVHNDKAIRHLWLQPQQIAITVKIINVSVYKLRKWSEFPFIRLSARQD